MLVATLAGPTAACELLDPARYEYSTVDGFDSITLEAVAEASGLLSGGRQVSIAVGSNECFSGCSKIESSTCEVEPQPDGALLIRFSARVRTTVDYPGTFVYGCDDVCVTPGGLCGDLHWPDGEALRFQSETGLEYVAEPDVPLPVSLRYRPRLPAE